MKHVIYFLTLSSLFSCQTRQQKINPADIKGKWHLDQWTTFLRLEIGDSSIFVDNSVDTIFTVKYSISDDTLITYTPITNRQFKNKIILLTEDTLVLDGIMDVKETRHYSKLPRKHNEEGLWFVAKCQALCDEEKGKFLSREKIKKHHTYNPYDTTQTISKDSIKVSFDFITNCCMDFSGKANIRFDTLTLEYGIAHDSVPRCDCLCDYRMIYQISRSKHWSKIKISHRGN
jgi:hypothetical protein